MKALVLVGIALASASSTIAAPACPRDATCFIAFGDQGMADANQTNVGRAMSRWVANPDTRTDFFIGLGDNFYADGVLSCDSSKFDTMFEMPYADIPRTFYMSLGNHDVAVDALAGHQLCYARKDTRADEAAGPRFFMENRYYTFTRGDAQFFVVYTPGLTLQSLWLGDDRHLEWLDRELGKSRARWKIVYGHGPMFGYGEHGHSKMLAQKVLPILAKHHVDAYFAGHEHNQQHVRHPAYRDIEFLISGTGGKTGTRGGGPLSVWPKAGNDAQIDRAAKNGFIYVVLTRTTFRAQYLTVDGRGNASAAYEFTRPKQSGTAPVPDVLQCGEPSKERSQGLCYPKCRAGFDGGGPFCLETCRAGYQSDPLTCRRDADIRAKEHYGRGAGYVAWKRDACERDHARGCEKHLAMWYPRCRAGFEAVGCCICRERTCPRGYKDDGGTCRRDAHIYGRKTYGRGVGSLF